MSQRWELEHGAGVYGNPPAAFDVGPGLDALPARFHGTLRGVDDPDLKMGLELSFDGRRVAVRELLVGSEREIRPITPQDVARLRVAEAVRLVSADAATFVQTRQTFGVDPDPRPDRRPVPEELELVAAVYAFEFAAWGDPRQAVMRCWGLPRSTANGWIRRAAEHCGGLPGVGVEHGER